MSLLRINNVIPDIIMSARVYFMKTVNSKDVSKMSLKDI